MEACTLVHLPASIMMNMQHHVQMLHGLIYATLGSAEMVLR